MSTAGRWLAGLAAVVGVVMLLAWLHHTWVDQLVDRRLTEQRDRLNAVATATLVEAEQRAFRAETKAAIAALEDEIERKRLEDAARVAADRARGAEQRLLQLTGDLHRRAAQAAGLAGAGPLAGEAAAAAGALGECVSEYRALGEVADRLSIQVTGLQRHVELVRELCAVDGASGNHP